MYLQQAALIRDWAPFAEIGLDGGKMPGAPLCKCPPHQPVRIEKPGVPVLPAGLLVQDMIPGNGFCESFRGLLKPKYIFGAQMTANLKYELCGYGKAWATVQDNI